MNAASPTASLPRRLLAALQIALLATGCVSVRTTGTYQAQGDDLGGVEVHVFPDDDARKAGAPGPRFVVGALERRDGGAWYPVFRSLEPAWTVVDLPPGKYRLRFSAVLDEAGNAVRIDDAGRTFRVKAGQVTEVEATLDHFPTALVVAGVVTAVVAAVLLHDWLEDHDLPVPPPPPPLLADAIFHVTVNVAAFHGWGPAYPDRPPVVTSHFPEDGALVAARRLRVIFAASEPLDPDEVGAETVTVLGERSGLVPGQVAYDLERWWVIWEPYDDLPRDDTFHVTLDPEEVEDLGGREMPTFSSFTFRTTP